MRVWLLQRSEPTPHDQSGSQRMMRTGIIAETLAKQGHDVVWWTSTFDHFNHKHRYRQNIRREVSEHYQIQYLYGFGYKKNISLSRLLDNVKVAKQFALLAPSDSLQPDIIFASIPTVELALEAIIYAKRNKIPILLDIRDLWPDVFFDLFPSYFKPLIQVLTMPMRYRLNYVCKSSTGIIGLTNGFLRWGLHHANRDKLDSDHVFPMAYLPQPVTESNIQKGRNFWRELGISKEEKSLLVVFFGTLGKTNNLIPVIDAFRILQDRKAAVRAIICGDGDSMSMLKKRADNLSNLILPGWMSAGQIKALLEIADVGIAPYINSYNYVANIPNKPSEYLSGGLLISSSLNEGSLYQLIVDRGCGFSYRDNPQILANKLEDLSTDIETLNQMKENARKTFSDLFDGNKVYGNLVNFMERLVAQSKV